VARLPLQQIVPQDECEPGQLRSVRIPDPDRMTEVLNAALEMTMHGVLGHAEFCKADIPSLIKEARLWLALGSSV